MKELRFFYTPDIQSGSLPQEEAQHAVRVLRLGVGDELNLMDGRGSFYHAEITVATNHKCLYRILEEEKQERAWKGHLCLGMAPTKLNDRVEWFAEKATEIGVDEFAFLDCQFSERKVLKTERIEKIVVSAVKQSHKAWMPEVDEMTPFRKFVEAERSGQKFICHCYEQQDIDLPTPVKGSKEEGEVQSCNIQKNEDLREQNERCASYAKPFLMDVIDSEQDCTVLIGPEGDFSVEEVRLAQEHGYQSVSLGKSRLRTETAGLCAVHMMQMKHSK